MSDRLRQLDALKADYESAREALNVARATGRLDAIDTAQEHLMTAEAAYHDAIYAHSPGMSGDDRTVAARALAQDHEARYQAQERERSARERVDDLSQEFTVDVVEEYQAAVDARRGLDLPEPNNAWVIDLRDEQEQRRDDFPRERRADKERDAYEEAKRVAFEGYER